MSDLSDRIYSPTPRRRLEFRRRGHVVQSSQLTAGALLLICAALAIWQSGDAMLSAARWLKGELSSVSTIDAAEYQPLTHLRTSLMAGIGLAAGMLTVLFSSAMAIELLQTGFRLAWNRVELDFSRLHEAGHLAAAFAPARWCGTCLRLAIPLCAMGLFLASRGEELSTLLLAAPPQLATALQTWGGDLFAQLGAAMLLTGGVHYAWRRWRHELALRMTRDEVREEERQSASRRTKSMGVAPFERRISGG
jgi:flagellar biosynthesis protein FlhB